MLFVDKDYFWLDECGWLLFGSWFGLLVDVLFVGVEVVLCVWLVVYFLVFEYVYVEYVWFVLFGFIVFGVLYVGMVGWLGWCGGYCGSGIVMVVYGGVVLVVCVFGYVDDVVFYDLIIGVGEV